MTFYAPKAGTLWLPCPILRWNESPAQDVDLANIPRVDGRTIMSAKRGATSIELNGLILGAALGGGTYNPAQCSIANAILYKEEILTALMGKTFDLYRYSDKYYTNCVLSEATFTQTDRPVRYLEYSLKIIATNPAVQAGALEGSSPWSDTMHETVDAPGGPTVFGPCSMPYSVQFVGSAVATPAAGDRIFYAYGPASSHVYVKRITLNAASLVAGLTGNTIVRVGQASLGATGDTISATITSAQLSTTAAFSPGLAFDTDANGLSAPIYVYIYSTGGLHNDLTVTLAVNWE
jgi:hypothetical protein